MGIPFHSTHLDTMLGLKSRHENCSIASVLFLVGPSVGNLPLHFSNFVALLVHLLVVFLANNLAESMVLLA